MKRRFKKNKKKKTAAYAGIATVLICVMFGNFAREDSLFEIVLRQAKSEAYTKMLALAAPSLSRASAIRTWYCAETTTAVSGSVM